MPKLARTMSRRGSGAGPYERPLPNRVIMTPRRTSPAFSIIDGSRNRIRLDRYLSFRSTPARPHHGGAIACSTPAADSAAIWFISCGRVATCSASMRTPRSVEDGARARRAHSLRSLPPTNFRAEPIQQTSFPDGFATVVVSSAVLHFARTDDDFQAMLHGPGGISRRAACSSAGSHRRSAWKPACVRPERDRRRYRLPDGTLRYLVDESLLMDLTGRLGGRLLDPIKTTVVQDQRVDDDMGRAQVVAAVVVHAFCTTVRSGHEPVAPIRPVCACC